MWEQERTTATSGNRRSTHSRRFEGKTSPSNQQQHQQQVKQDRTRRRQGQEDLPKMSTSRAANVRPRPECMPILARHGDNVCATSCPRARRQTPPSRRLKESVFGLHHTLMFATRDSQNHLVVGSRIEHDSSGGGRTAELVSASVIYAGCCYRDDRTRPRQVPVHPADRHKTAFCTAEGLWQFKVLPFGLSNSAATYQRLVQLLLAGVGWDVCLAYLDDIIVFTRTFDDHLRTPRRCLHDSGGLEVTFLGHVVSRQGVAPDPANISRVQHWPTPTNQTEVRSFVGLASFYRKFVPAFATVAEPLVRLTSVGGECTTTLYWKKIPLQFDAIVVNDLADSIVTGFESTDWSTVVTVHYDRILALDDSKPRPMASAVSKQRVTVAMKEQLKREVDKMTAEVVIESVTVPTPWVSSLVTVMKPSEKLRICTDPRDLNVARKRSHYPAPTIEDIVPELKKAKVFSVLDAKSGYWQIALDEESSMLTTFNTKWEI
ncbi:hypothetical protein Bbelb_187320 [Branchiostoma belcheri]|nr:hypothetical protein Bbelb_187320 [Branchiostoma belcheri]